MGCNLKSCCTSKSAKPAGALFFVLMFSAMESAAEALQSPASTVEIGLSVLRFNYTEYNDAGARLDRELGSIPGLSFKLTRRFSAWEWEGLASYHHGHVNYTGQTQSGAPYNTRTDEENSDFALRLGHWFDASYPFMPYAGLGYRRWDRNILPATLSGLFESYRWTYGWLGTKFMAFQKENSHIMLDVGLIKPLATEMHVYIRGTDNAATVLYPKGKTGLRMMLTSQRALSENSTLILEPYFEYWRLGRSPSVTTGGDTVYEPASKTRNLGLNLRLGRMF